MWRRWYSAEESCLPSSWPRFDSRPTHHGPRQFRSFRIFLISHCVIYLFIYFFGGFFLFETVLQNDLNCRARCLPEEINKNKMVRRPGIEPGSTAWKAAMLTTIPPTPQENTSFDIIIRTYGSYTSLFYVKKQRERVTKRTHLSSGPWSRVLTIAPWDLTK